MNNNNYQKPIIIFTVGKLSIAAEKIPEVIRQISARIENKHADDFISIVLYDAEGTNKVECINPVLLQGDEYKHIEELVNKLKDQLKDDINNNPNV